MSFPRYAEYKDSGVEWLGEVPAHWDVSPLKRLIDRNDGGVWGDDPDGEDDVIVLRSTEQTVDGRWKLDEPARRKLSAQDRVAARLAVGDLLITKSSGSSLHIGKATLVTGEIARLECCYSNFMQRIRLRADFDAQLAWHILNNEITRTQFDLASNSTTGLANLNGTMIGDVLLAVPPPLEQTAIAAFLDRETGKIDALVEEQEKLIALLKEKRQAVISHAVTKGLNPDAPMKPSGIEWLGDVPEHWQVVPLKWLTDPERPIMYGIVLPGPDAGEGIPILKGGNVKPSRMNLESMARTTPEIEAPYARARLKAGDLVYSIRGSIGDCEPVPESLDGSNITQDVARVAVAPDYCPRWVRWALLASAVREELASGSLGAAIRGVNIFDLKRANLPTPLLREQLEIADFLDKETSQLDELTSEAERAILLLKERRSALISAAVTGQIDVRDFAARLTAADDEETPFNPPLLRDDWVRETVV